MVAEQIAADAIVARHLSASIVDTEHLVAESVDATIIAADSITANHIQAGAINGDHISITTSLVLDEGGSAVFGDSNIIIDTDPAGGGAYIIVAPDGGITGNDYALLSYGDITFFYYDSISAQHYEYKSVKRTEEGVAENGDTVVIPGYWKNQPLVRLTPLQIPIYNREYPDRDQTLRMSADNLELVLGTTDRWQFDVACYLALSGGALGGSINQYVQDTSPISNPGPNTFSTHVPQSYGDVTYLQVSGGISAYRQTVVSGYVLRYSSLCRVRLYYQLPDLSWTYAQAGDWWTTTALQNWTVSLSGLNGIGAGGFYVVMYFLIGSTTLFYDLPGTGNNFSFLGGNTTSYITNVTGSETLLDNGMVVWEAIGE